MVEDLRQKQDPRHTHLAASKRFSTRQVENLFYEYIGLEEVAVFHVTDTDGVDKLVAFIVLNKEGVTEKDLMDFLIQSGQIKEELLPQMIKIVPKLPKSPSGKVLRQRLMDEFDF